MEKYLKATPLLDYNHPQIAALVDHRNWQTLEPADRVRAVYNFVRDEILFGYNVDDAIPASAVLADGYGQCNTKATLLMGLLRAVGVPNRIHGFTINKALQEGAVTGFWYRMAPQNILHSWVEVYVAEQWFFLEGVILDLPYLQALQRKFMDCPPNFCGYGAYTEDFTNPQVDWNLNHTFIQEKGINQDFGLFDSPDDFYREHRQKMSGLKRFLYRTYVRHVMNRNVARIREA